MIKCIIFDLDGTLLDTLDDIKDSINESLISFSYDSNYKREDIKRFIGFGVSNLIARACEKFSLKDGEVSKVLDKYNEIYKQKRVSLTQPYQDAKDTLLLLKEKGIKLCVLSNKPDKDTKACISYFFGDLFDIVLGQRDGYEIKPDPNGIFEIIGKLNLEKSEVVYVGDMLSDIETSKNAGIKFIGAQYGYAIDDIFLDEKYKISSFKDIITVLNEVNYDC